MQVETERWGIALEVKEGWDIAREYGVKVFPTLFVVGDDGKLMEMWAEDLSEFFNYAKQGESYLEYMQRSSKQ